MRNSYFPLLALLLGAISFGDCGKVKGKCEPEGKKAFTWGECQDNYKGVIEVHSVDARQGQDNKTVEQNGGLDMKKALNLIFHVKNNYEKNEITQHLFDFAAYQYADDDGTGCTWYQLDTQGMTDGVPASKLIKDNATYKNKPSRVVAVVDFPNLMSGDYGDVSEMLESGDYYAFDVTERDGDKKLSCVRLQARIK